MSVFPVTSPLSSSPQTVTVLEPYRLGDAWVFDDPVVGLKQEPFVQGVTEMIDRLVADIPGADRGFRLLFSIHSFEGQQTALSWVRSDDVEGNWYRVDGQDAEGWLCPALLFYFAEPPKKIYVKAESK